MAAGETPVSEIMQREFMHLSPDDGLDFVEEVMQIGRVRHFPVLEDGKLVGIVSQRDLLAASLTRVLAFEGEHRRSFLKSVPVSEVMTRDVRTIPPETELREIAQMFARNKIGCAVVVAEDGAPLGLVTETDLLTQAYLV
ncbi:MAG: CBS domain-containing protein [Myxococcales bacterium]|nr:CBS domain-containing protein [Myxococcales bacterium]